MLYDSHPLEPGAKRTQNVRVDLLPIDRQTIFGQTDYTTRVKPGQHFHVDFRMPVAPVPPATAQYGHISHAPFNANLRKTIASWVALQRPAMRVDLPEPKVVNTFYASLDDILLPRYQLSSGAWVQAVNLQRYHAFWLRDAAMMTHALDLAGLHRQAGQNLPFFLTGRTRPATSSPGPASSTGSARRCGRSAIT